MPPLLVPAVAAVIGVEAAGAFVIGSLTVGTLIANIAFVGISIGVMALVNRPRAQAQTPFKPLAGSITYEPQVVPVALRFRMRGTNRDAGQQVARFSDGTTLGYVRVISCRPCQIVAHQIDNEQPALHTGSVLQNAVTIFGTYTVTTVDQGANVKWPYGGIKWVTFIGYYFAYGQQVPYVLGYGPAGFLEFHSASDAGYASDLIRRYFPALWTNSHKLRGLSYVASTWQARGTSARAATYPNLFPVQCEVTRGCPVWDPRDPAQTFLDAGLGAWSPYNTTWQYSANCSLHALDYLTAADCMNYPLDWILLDSFKTAATRCDRPTAGLDDVIAPFAEVHLKETDGEERRDVLARFEAACDGQVFVTPDGKVGFRVLDWIEPTVTLDERAIGPFTLEVLQGVHNAFNVLQVTHNEPRLRYTKTPTGEVRDEVSIAAQGREVKPLDLDMVQDPNQAWRLGVRALRRGNPPRKIHCQGGLRMLAAIGEEVVRVSLPTFGIDGVFRFEGPGEARDRANYAFSLYEVTPDMFEDAVLPADPVSPDLPDVVVATANTPLTPDAPTANTFVATAVPLTVYASAAVTPPTSMSGGGWSAAQLADTISYAQFRWRPVGGTTWTYWSTAIGQYEGQSPVVSASVGDQYEIQAWLKSPEGPLGDYSASTVVTF